MRHVNAVTQGTQTTRQIEDVSAYTTVAGFYDEDGLQRFAIHPLRLLVIKATG